MVTSADQDPSTGNAGRWGVSISGQAQVEVDGDLFTGDKTVHIAAEQAYDVRGLANPYMGLWSFTYADRVKHTGPRQLITETVARVTAPAVPVALLFVTGASGSGKSSFAQAGLIPAIEQHYIALTVKHAVFRPGHEPFLADLTVPEVRRLLEVALPLPPRSREVRQAWSDW